MGASKPSDAGLYFQWGDTQGYTADQFGEDKGFNFDVYKWNPSGDGETFSKYTTTGATLDLEDDAAHVHMGGKWHMPSPIQIQELLDNTTYSEETMNDVFGMAFTSKKDISKYIFFPYTGYAAYDSLHQYALLNNESYGGYIWSSMLDTTEVRNGQFLSLYTTRNPQLNEFESGQFRNYGLPVRGVIG